MTKHEHGVVAGLMEAAERVRGLTFTQPVAVHVEDAQAIQAYARAELRRDEVEVDRIVYVALGLLPPSLDVEALLVRLLGEQVLGYYDAREERLVVREDVMRGFAETHSWRGAEDVLLHELVHAQQDQHFHLGESLDRERSTDAENAFRALVEGDATLAMLGLGMEREGMPLSEITRDPAFLRQIAEENPATDSPELARAPAIIRVTMLSAYADGVAFAAHLHRRGGWKSVNRAHRAPPTTTETILHPGRHNPAPVEPGPLLIADPLSDMGFGHIKSDTLGELEIGVYFSRGLPLREARRAADGWNGDRLEVYRGPGGELAFAWLTHWDSERDAHEAAAAARSVVESEPPSVRPRCAVLRKERRVLLLKGFDPQRLSNLAELAMGST
ncbi:MAG: hypothetical protein OXU20_39010 [Myxococcales bacterium]|nr:hypothetical protein [Myxococcales bacterium]MDD9971979.1 hypothetical protein [Myxococcales bacterium]